MKPFTLMLAAAASLCAGAALASPQQHSGQSIIASHGPIITTGHVGTTQTTTLPGGGGQGLLSNNGNGTSTLTSPSGLTTVVPTSQ